MQIISCKLIDMNKYGKKSSCKVLAVHIQINDIKERAVEMIKLISDGSWIDKLSPVAKMTYQARAKRTVKKLVLEVFNKVDDVVTEDFGEYVVSVSAQDVLVGNQGHSRVPLAELIKEKDSGNPGFDFHTESDSKLIAFGEAKYSGKGNPHGKALSQICKFIEREEDAAEFDILENFVSPEAINNAMQNKKAYIAAFSLNNDKPESILYNSFNSKFINKLLDYPELYLIGVEIIAR